MAPKVTSSSNRSARKPVKPRFITTSKGRGNRAKVSSARVTNDTTRPPNGSGGARVTNANYRGVDASTARVTGGTPASPPLTRRSRVNGRVVAGTDTRGNRPAPAKPAAQPAKPPAKPPVKPSVKPSGTFKAPDIPKPATSGRPPTTSPGRPPVRPSGRFTAPRIPPSQAQIDREVARTTSSSRGRGRYPGGLTGRLSAETVGIPTTPASAVLRLATANFGTSGESPDVRARILGYRDAAHQRQAIAEAQARQRGRSSSRPPSRFANARQENLDRINRDPKFQAPEPRRDNSQPPRSNSGGGSTPPAPPRNRGSGGTTRPRSSSAPSTSSNAGMKNQDKNYRGSLFEKTFGYKPGQAPDQLKMKDNFDTKSDIYSPSTKVDGSKLDALKIDQKKVNEYTRRKRRYSD